MATTTTLRDQIAGMIVDNWQFSIPVLWENMPSPSPLPDKGWVSVQIRFGRSIASGWGKISTLQRGSVQMHIAVHQGEGMETSDAVIKQLIKRFDQKKIDHIQFGQANVHSPVKDDGVVITTIMIRFHASL